MLKYYIRKFFSKDLDMEKTILWLKFLRRQKRAWNLSSPVYYNDKLQWLKFNWYSETVRKCVDKYSVREYVGNKIGREYLNEIHEVYDDFNLIDISKLPDKFVIKATHGSGMNIICRDKENHDWGKEIEKINQWMKIDYSWGKGEWAYKNLKPRILVEKFLENDSGEELLDYRFFCFNGEPKFITVDVDINNKVNTRRNLYDLNWQKIDATISYPNDMGSVVRKPKNLGLMESLARKLSEGFPHVRVDFYEINGEVYFGELTFWHQSGMGNIQPKSFEKKMGDWIDLKALS